MKLSWIIWRICAYVCLAACCYWSRFIWHHKWCTRMGGASVHPAGHSSNLTLCAYGCVEVILFLTVQKVSSESSASSMICKTMMETVAVKHTEVLKTCWSSVCVKGSKRSKLLYWSISANFSELIRLLERCPRALVVGIWHGKTENSKV